MENEMPKTQIQAVKNHLVEGNSITNLGAYSLFGVTRLSSIIYELRKRGLNIISIQKSCVNRFGNHCNYVEYKYVEPKDI